MALVTGVSSKATPSSRSSGVRQARPAATGAAMIVRALKDHGVKHIFGYPGDGINGILIIDPDEVVMPTWYRPDPGLAGDLAFILFSRAYGKLVPWPVTNHRFAMSAFGAAAANPIDWIEVSEPACQQRRYTEFDLTADLPIPTHNEQDFNEIVETVPSFCNPVRLPLEKLS